MVFDPSKIPNKITPEYMESKYADRWTRNPTLKNRLISEPSYLKKLSILKELAPIGLDKNRVDPRTFSGTINIFDGSTRSIDRGKPFTSGILDKDGNTLDKEYYSYEQMSDNDLAVLENRKKSFRHIESMKSASNAMEMIFTDYAHAIFGENVEVVVPSEFDDVHNGADLIVIKKDIHGNVLGIFCIDFFVGINPKTNEKFLKRKLFRQMNQIRNGYLSRINYIQTQSGEQLSSENLTRFILPISVENLEILAERYYKGDLEGDEFSEILRNLALENINLQIEMQEKIAQTVKKKVFFKRGKRINLNSKSMIETALKNVRSLLPNKKNSQRNIKDSVSSNMQEILKIYSANILQTNDDLTKFQAAMKNNKRES